jgi:antitoxin (DNA-binding transcriptional repressor) of toxin-antitoxin stability system
MRHDVVFEHQRPVAKLVPKAKAENRLKAAVQHIDDAITHSQQT